MRCCLTLFAAVFAAVAMPALAGVEAPVVSIKQIAELPTPLPFPYDGAANADADVAHAFQLAKTSGKRVLIELGGNWCADCRILVGVMQLPEVKAFIDRNYEIVNVDIGRFDRNLDIPERFGIQKLVAVPVVIVADADGQKLNVSDASELENTQHLTPQGIADWFARWAKPNP